MSAASKIDTVAQIYGRGGGRRPRHLLPGLPLNVKTNPSPVLLQNLNHQERQGQPRQLGMLEERGMGGRWVEGWVSEGCLSGRGSPCARPEHRFSLLSSTRPSTLVSQSQPSTSRCVDTEAGVWKSGPLPDVGVSIAEASISGEYGTTNVTTMIPVDTRHRFFCVRHRMLMSSNTRATLPGGWSPPDR